MDWKKIIQDLIDSGMTQAEIGSHVKIKQASVSDLYTGITKSPRWDVGNALQKLHSERLKKAKRAA